MEGASRARIGNERIIPGIIQAFLRINVNFAPSISFRKRFLEALYDFELAFEAGLGTHEARSQHNISEFCE